MIIIFIIIKSIYFLFFLQFGAIWPFFSTIKTFNFFLWFCFIVIVLFIIICIFFIFFLFIILRFSRGVCIKTSFLLVQNISHQVVLGTTFLTQIYPFYVDNKGLHTKFNEQDLTFDFIKGLKIQEINQIHDKINLIQNKKLQIQFLQK